jgi:hypothetical protein
MYFFNPATGVSTLLTTITTGSTDQRLLLINPTKILWVLNNQFYEFDTATNVATLLASFPVARSWALFTYNGEIYYIEGVLSGPTQSNVYTITLSPTFQRNLVINLPFQASPETYIGNLDLATTCNIPVSVSGNFGDIAQIYNMENYTFSPHCSWPSSTGQNYVTAPLLNEVPGPLCNCTTEAGTWDWANLPPPGAFLEICAGGSFTLPHNGDQILEPGQNLGFAIVNSNQSSHFYNWIPNEVVYVFDSPVISLIPGIIQPNVLYRLYPVASNAPPGSVNFADECRDIQYPLIVRWKTPTVTFTAPAQACTVGCRTVNVTLQGDPPFQLSYEVIFDGGSPQVFNQTFTSTSGTIQVCPPPNFNGTVQINALSLTDGDNCTCN